MVGGPLLGLPSQGTGGVAPHDEDAKEVIAFSRPYAGKLEEVKDRVDVEEKKVETPKELNEEQRLAEDKKLDYAEERVTLPVMKPKDPNMVDEAQNQFSAGDYRRAASPWKVEKEIRRE